MSFLVIAFRYGTNEYVFPIGIFQTKSGAIESAKCHREFRGGKYDHKLYEIENGKEYDAEECKGVWITGPLKENQI